MDWLARHTRDALQQRPGFPLCVAFSGGGDSTALLDVLASLPEARQRGLRALHVDHGMSPQSGAWANHCREMCARLDIALTVVRTDVDMQAGRGPEAAARDARLVVFAEHLAAGEVLLLAHHRDDQAETIVLKLLRGAGPHGLAGMREWRPLAQGSLWRPWLEVSRQTIHQWLIAHDIDFVDDPANDDPDMTRSWLRREIMPRISNQLPQATASIIQSGQLCADTRDYLDQQVSLLDRQVAADGSLDARDWLAQPRALRGLTLERWLHGQGLNAPTVPQRHDLERQIAQADPDRVPHLHWPGTDVRLWRGRMHAMQPLPSVAADWHHDWHGEPVDLPLGSLHLIAAPATASPLPHDAIPRKLADGALTVRLRRGGEYLHPAGDACGRELRYIFQQHGLPPWLRPYCPLIFKDETLLAVAGLCLSEEGDRFFAPLGVRPEWRYHV